MNPPEAPAHRDPEPPLPPGDDASCWTSARLLGHPAMDDTHREFYTVVTALRHSAEHTLGAALEAVDAHLTAHFAQEDQWMHDSGFPPRDCHLDEHAAVLASMRDVRQAIASGQAGIGLAHDFAEHLLGWFPGHADYLDAALATWLCKRSHGGAPVVVRRRDR